MLKKMIKTVGLLTLSGITLLTATLSAQTLIVKKTLLDSSFADGASGAEAAKWENKQNASLIGDNVSYPSSVEFSQGIWWRAFDNGSITLNDILNSTDTLLITVNSTFIGKSVGTLSFGVANVTTNNNIAYVVDNLGGSAGSSAFRYRAKPSTTLAAGKDGTLQGTAFADNSSGPILGNSGTTSILRENNTSPHEITFSIAASQTVANALTFTFKIDDYLISTQDIVWNSAMLNETITGFSFRNEGSVLDFSGVSVKILAVPEPSTLVLLGIGFGILAIARRRR